MLPLAVALTLALAAPPATRPGWQPNVIVDGAIDGVAARHGLLVYLPKGYDANAAARWPLVIALHGWGHSPKMVRDEGVLAPLADRYGVVIAVPDMGKTVYESALYPDAVKAWSRVPGARWVGEVVLPYMRAHYAVAQDRAETAIIGYSTGGRGALLVAEAYPEFAFAGSASGTFDLMHLDPKTGEYRIHEAVFGPRARFPERWQKDDVIAPERLAHLAGVRVYAAHGAADRVVDPAQLTALSDALRGTNVTVTTRLEPGAGHDWRFWNRQWPRMFAAMTGAP